MTFPPWLLELVNLSLTYPQQLGLAFLLGSFVVATWSDLKYLAAQREFLEVWLFFLLVVLIHDIAQVNTKQISVLFIVLKWFLIAGLSIVSLREVGWLFRLARGDVAALAAAASLLPPVLVVLLFVFAKGLSYGAAPLLSRGRNVYPFMPVVTLATLLVLAVGALIRPG